MTDEILMWVLVAMAYVGGFLHGWIAGGTHTLKRCTREIRMRWKEMTDAN